MAAGVSAATGDATVRTARRWPTAALVALTVILTFESFRVLFPHLYGLKEREGLMTVLIAFLAVAVAPFLSPLLARLLKPHRAVALGALLLGAWRLVVQFLDPIAAVTAIAGAIVALITLTLVLSAPLPGGPGARAAGLLAGFALDAAILGAFITWEPAWQEGAVAGVAGALLAAALLAAAALVYRDARGSASAGTSPAFSGGIAVGTILALEFMFLANSAFLSAASGLTPRPGDRDRRGGRRRGSGPGVRLPEGGQGGRRGRGRGAHRRRFPAPQGHGRPGAGALARRPTRRRPRAGPGAGAGRQGPGARRPGAGGGLARGTGRHPALPTAFRQPARRWTTPT